MAAIPEGMASDVALFGTRAEVLDGAEAFEAAGITHLVLDCTSARRSLRRWHPGRLRGHGGLRLEWPTCNEAAEELPLGISA